MNYLLLAKYLTKILPKINCDLIQIKVLVSCTTGLNKLFFPFFARFLKQSNSTQTIISTLRVVQNLRSPFLMTQFIFDNKLTPDLVEAFAVKNSDFSGFDQIQVRGCDSETCNTSNCKIHFDEMLSQCSLTTEFQSTAFSRAIEQINEIIQSKLFTKQRRAFGKTTKHTYGYGAHSLHHISKLVPFLRQVSSPRPDFKFKEFQNLSFWPILLTLDNFSGRQCWWIFFSGWHFQLSCLQRFRTLCGRNCVTCRFV